MSIELCQSSTSASRDVGEDAPLGRLLDEAGIGRVDQRDHRAGRLADDPLDQAEGVIRARAEADERDVGSLPGGDRSDVFDVDLARDHLVPQCRDDRGDEREAILALVGDQHAEMLGFAVAHPGLRGRPSLTSGVASVQARQNSEWYGSVTARLKPPAGDRSGSNPRPAHGVDPQRSTPTPSVGSRACPSPRRSTRSTWRRAWPHWSGRHRKKAIWGWLAFVVIVFMVGNNGRHDADLRRRSVLR